MSNKVKSPFEIRLRLLELAQEYLSSSYTNTMEMVKSQNEANLELANKLGTEAAKSLQDFKMPDVPTFYNFNDVLELAERMNSFISKR